MLKRGQPLDPLGRVAAGLLILGALVLLGRWVPPFEFRAWAPSFGPRLLDRHGTLLRAPARAGGPQGGRAGLSPWLNRCALASEDQRFFLHAGVDPLALARAMAANLRSGRVRLGGSTLTQQLARVQLQHARRTWWHKLEETALALYLEARLSKRTLLQWYFDHAPYGHECYGIHAASRFYFGRAPDQLSLGQAAFLTILPRNPNRYDPLRHRDRVLRQQQRLLDRLRALGHLTAAEHSAARSEPIELKRPETTWEAPHFCDWVLKRYPGRSGDLATTLDLDLQRPLEQLVRTYVDQLKPFGITQAAVVVLDRRDHAVRVLIGSADYFDAEHSGQVNGALALRQPGSTLKPFTYGLALEQGLPTSYLLPDLATHVPGRGGDFTPRNYDDQYHGPVRLRTALGCSYNVPAVRILNQLGEAALLDRLHRAGLASLRFPAAHYGLGLTLGDGEVNLLELTRAYAAIANQGVFRGEQVLLAEPSPEGGRVFSPEVSFLLAHMLSDHAARWPAFGACSAIDLPFPTAVKTGTTKNYRDNWTLGFTAAYVVGVWVGNFDGAPMHGISGVSGAGPLFRDTLLFLHREHRPPGFSAPEGVEILAVCPLSGDRVGLHCPNRMQEYFLAGHAPETVCAFHAADGRVHFPALYRDWVRSRYLPDQTAIQPGGRFYIDFPDQGDVFKLAPGERRRSQRVSFKAVAPGSFQDFRWFLDGRSWSQGLNPSWTLEPGQHTLRLEAWDGTQVLRTPQVQFLVLP